MSSLMWYIYDFARKAWAQGFANAKTSPEIVEKPSRFRNFPNVIKEYCIGCGACISSCPSPNAIKLVRDEDDETKEGITYPIINKSACIRCGFCAEVCPTEPKTLECGENHLLKPEFNIIQAMIDARKEQNLTQKELSKRTGITQADISRIENGTRNPSLEMLKRLAKGMGMRLKLELEPYEK